MLRKKIETICKVTALSLLFVVGSSTVAMAEPSYNDANTPPVIIMDLAHLDSANDCGASYKEINERDLVNTISEKATDILVSRGYTVIFTRQPNQPIGLKDRVRLAQSSEYAYYISIHANSCPEENTGTGVESYYNGEGAMQLGDAITDDLSNEFGLAQRGDKKSNFYTKRIQESVLIEIGFLNHIKDREIMLKNQDRIAQIIADNIDSAYQNQVLSQK